MPSRSAAYPTGRTTPKRGSASAGRAGSRPASQRLKASKLQAMNREKWDVNESRSVHSGWVWRGFFMLSMLAVGVAIIFFGNHKVVLGILWFVIAAGWFATAMWLWRKHTNWVRGG